MSVRVMALIFAHKFPKLLTKIRDVEKRILPVSGKAVMLALGDHASDDGEGAYPSLTTLEIKTGLSRQALITTLGALKNHGYLTYVGVSRLGTSKYKINIDQLTAFTTTVNSVDQPSKQRLPEVVNSVDPIHPVNHPKPSLTTTTTATDKTQVKKPDPVITAYESNIGAATSIILDAIESERKRHQNPEDADKWMLESISEAVKNGKRNWAYCESILSRWHRDGFKSDNRTVKENKYPTPKPVTKEYVEPAPPLAPPAPNPARVAMMDKLIRESNHANR